MLYFGKSDTGRTRANNEDNFSTLRLCKNLLLCVICDGMGGYEGGDIASELAIITFTDYVKTHLLPFIENEDSMFDLTAAKTSGIDIEDILIKAVYAANTTICQRGNHDRKLKDMGTTLVAVLIIDNILYIANVGDSRLYMINNDEVKQITRDHSYAQLLMDAGSATAEEAAKSPYRHAITRYVGSDAFHESETDIYVLEFNSGIILMCSDGLYNYSPSAKYNEFVKDITDIDTMTSAVDNLIASANANGGRDNITVILIKSPDDVEKSSYNEDADIKLHNGTRSEENK